MSSPILIPISAADAIRWLAQEIGDDYLFAHQTPDRPEAIYWHSLPDRAALPASLRQLLHWQRRGMVTVVARTSNWRWLGMLTALGCRVISQESMQAPHWTDPVRFSNCLRSTSALDGRRELVPDSRPRRWYFTCALGVLLARDFRADAVMAARAFLASTGGPLVTRRRCHRVRLPKVLD